MLGDSTVLTAELAEELVTPAYLYDLAEVRGNHDRLVNALPAGTGLYYSVKANPHPAVLAQLRDSGARAEVCSPGELAAVLAAGWPAGEVLYGGPGKRDSDVDSALALGVRTFSVDSPEALDQLDRLAAGRGVTCQALVRINDDRPVPGQGLAMTGVPSQFGADAAWVVAEPRRFAGRPHVTVVGLHLYMGTNLVRMDDLVTQFARSARTALRVTQALTPYGMDLRVLDLGGGFGAPFATAGTAVSLDGLAPRLAELFDETFPAWRDGRPRLDFESGRYLVGTAGTLLVRVLDAKTSHGRRVVVLDSGINHLGGMSGLRRLPPLRPALVRRPGARPDIDDDVTETLVAGPLCTPLDTWAPAAPLPPLRPGDLLAVPNVGAYGLYASLVAFLGHPMPTELVVDSEKSPGSVLHASQLTLARAQRPGTHSRKETRHERSLRPGRHAAPEVPR
ncbi:type III PLP-dependent enzyme [Micromonospora sp. NPDC047074]|uniref:type III PLP-dependent enzyme n=1 Tax=Micromonospora sp. NPDC047074 TaxID=3154339 RepID=UPI0033FE14FE